MENEDPIIANLNKINIIEIKVAVRKCTVLSNITIPPKMSDTTVTTLSKSDFEIKITIELNGRKKSKNIWGRSFNAELEDLILKTAGSKLPILQIRFHNKRNLAFRALISKITKEINRKIYSASKNKHNINRQKSILKKQNREESINIVRKAFREAVQHLHTQDILRIWKEERNLYIVKGVMEK